MVFVGYALLLTTGTHWPRLTLPTELPSDKTIHLVAYGVLTALLWRTHWIRSRWVAVIVAGLWSLLDEYSQNLPGLGRVASWYDAAANVMGVTIAGAWLAALRPVGGATNRMRLAFRAYTWDEVFGHPATWALLAGVGVAAVAPVVALWSILAPGQAVAAQLIALNVCLLGSGFVLLAVRRRAVRRAVRRRPCFTCGRASGNLDFDDDGRTSCPTCAAPVHVGQWMEPALPSLTRQVRLARGAVLLGAAILLAAFALLAVLPTIYAAALQADMEFVPRLARAIGGLPRVIQRAIDITALGLVLALAVRVYRRGLARHFDRRAVCTACGHDLRATPVTRGVGRCGECGAAFVRLPPEGAGESSPS